MVRNYQRKTNQQSWNEDSMKTAITEYKRHQYSLRKAAARNNVPVCALFRRIKKEGDLDTICKKKLGRFVPVFKPEHERELKEYLLSMEKRLFGLSVQDFRSLAYQYAERNNISHNFSEKTKMAGRDWVAGFIKRNREISLRQPENTSAARASAFNKPNVNNFFKLLGELMDKYQFSASCIYNCDETGITTVPNKPSKILSLKGKKQVGSLSSGERGTTVSVEICCNALGQFIPPLIIFPRVRRNPLFEVGLPPETKATYHPSGWMQTEIFAPTWIKHFIQYAKPSEGQPVLLILDGHATHVKNLELIEIARQNHIHILVLPPHTSHRMQPLDVSFMYPLSTYYEQAVKSWLRNNPGKVVTVQDVGFLFGQAYGRAATSQNAVNGFAKTGICPFNPHIFPEELFEPSQTTNREELQESEETITDSNRSEESGVQSSAEKNIESMPSASISHITQSTKTPKKCISSASSHILTSSTETSKECLPSTSSNHITPPKMTNRVHISPADIIPIPKAGPKKSVAKRRSGKTSIITLSPYLDELKQKSSKAGKKRDIVKRKIKPDSEENNGTEKSKKKIKTTEERDSSSCDSDYSVDDSTDVNFTDTSGSSDKEMSLDKNRTIINEGDFVLVELSSQSNKTKKAFVAQVQKLCSESETNQMTYEVKFMRNYRQHGDIFIFPQIDDISIVYKEEIKGVLTDPFWLRHGKIRFL